ncbi:hypothetical protein EUGRSUZ_A00525 [Eucalyptus grandis]|uniref:Uncharacterized protein n=2 Tax=Eucalyptus grandis TaxID=71139 RepID=A0ACC3M2Q7_EUCGR|nr:hypothetical protein EUGRSUZ_A00525 [Eucalyptus grandis]
MTSKRSLTVFGILVDAQYTYSVAFKLFGYAKFVACACYPCYSFLQSSDEETTVLVVMTLVTAGCAATTAIGYVGKHGNAHIGWMPIYDHLDKFCNKVTISITISYVSFLLMIVTVISACNSSIVFWF